MARVVANDWRPAHSRWRAALKRVASGPLLGFLCLGAGGRWRLRGSSCGPALAPRPAPAAAAGAGRGARASPRVAPRNRHHRSVGGWIPWRRENRMRSSPLSASFDTKVCHSLAPSRFALVW